MSNQMDPAFASLLAEAPIAVLLVSYQDLLKKAKTQTGVQRLETIGAISQVISELKNKNYPEENVAKLLAEVNQLS